MKIGHICLVTGDDANGSRFVNLVEAIAQCDVEQHVLVASFALGQRLGKCANVTVGPIVQSPVMAYCLMPSVEIVHVHDDKSGQAGLLLTLTRSIPFVITTDEHTAADRNPLAQAILNRAVRNVHASPQIGSSRQLASEHLGLYAQALEGRLEFPKNSNCRH
jgi:hypothetical protein